MEARFQAAQQAIREDDPARLRELLRADPELLRLPSRDPRDHPNLLNCLVLETPPRQELERLLEMFREGGADLAGALVAGASVDNRRAVRALLDCGTPIDPETGWSALDEALYWGHAELVAELRARGARVRTLRGWAAVGDVAGVRGCFDAAGELTGRAGELAWPFARPLPVSQRRDRGALLTNALAHACQWGARETAEELLRRGAGINDLAAGFDFNGTPLHFAALHNRRAMCDWLLAEGADPAQRDGKVGQWPEEWAAYGGHSGLSRHLTAERLRRAGG